MKNNVVKFPGCVDAPRARIAPLSVVPACASPVHDDRSDSEKKLRTSFLFTLLARLYKPFWTVLVLTWPVLKWIISIDVFVRFLGMLIFWDTPGSNAGWVFVGHFSLLTILTVMVSVKPADR